MEELKYKGMEARKASRILERASSDLKNKALTTAATLLTEQQEKILSANRLDLKQAEESGLKGAFVERLTLNQAKVKSMAEGLLAIAALEDPVGETLWMKKRPNGLQIGQRRVPLGVIGIIYESRPNVTADVFGLCLKTGNAALLRGGKEAIHTNRAILELLQKSLISCGLPAEGVQLVEDTSRESAVAMMKMNGLLDVLIPRGGASLIRTVVENSTVPVIETGVGNCHIYVDEAADFGMALPIILNAKTQRPGVCNAAESMLVHQSVAASFLPLIGKQLNEAGVEIRGDEQVTAALPYAKSATEEDWGTEYLDLIMSVKVVGSVEEAIDHIHRYGTKHSESIVTNDYAHAQKFLDEVDAAAVYVNASTRFTDGFEFGFGAEIGISTQKLHARGPMGLKELTTIKYVIYGNGQIRK